MARRLDPDELEAGEIARRSSLSELQVGVGARRRGLDKLHVGAVPWRSRLDEVARVLLPEVPTSGAAYKAATGRGLFMMLVGKG